MHYYEKDLSIQDDIYINRMNSYIICLELK